MRSTHELARALVDAPLRATESSPFDLAFGLPLHPLAVHVPVVLLPLGAIGVVLVLLMPRWRGALQWPVVAVLGIATVGALIAKLSGEALAARVGSPGQHEELGNWVLALAALLLAGMLAWVLWHRRLVRHRRSSGVIGLILGTVLAAVAIGSVIVAVLTGHTGATQVWQDRVDVPTAVGGANPTTSTPATPTDSPDASAPEATTGDPTEGARPITLAEVAQHDDSAECWVAIEGTVYDVTAWIPQHPGGPDRILAVCGTDASAEFATQHSGAALPAEQLSRFAIGALAER